MIRDKVVPALWLLLAALIIGASVGFAARAHALTDGTETMCQPRSWSDCQTVERFTPVHHPILKITGHMGGRLHG